MIEKINDNLINEIFKSAFKSKTIFELLLENFEYHYFPTQEYKEIWKFASTHYKALNSLPTIGIIAEQNKDNVKLLQTINLIKEADEIDKAQLIPQIESYLKKVQFLNLYDEIGTFYESGKKEEAINALKKGAEKITGLSLEAKTFKGVYSGFSERYLERVSKNLSGISNESKSVFGIDCLDERTRGGLERGKTCLITARSGAGKSKFLKWIAYSNALLGKKVLHFQLEGSEDEVLRLYDAMISGSSAYDIEKARLTDERVTKIIEAVNRKKVKKEDIHVVAYEEFGSATMTKIRSSCLEYIKQYGNIDTLVVDYLDECDPGDGLRYQPTLEGQKNKKQAVAKYFTNLCIEIKCTGFIATQASDVPPSIWNDTKQVLTRSNIGNDKNLPNKFSAHITINQTADEKKNNIMRLYEDKFRDYPDGETHTIATAFEFEKFYDRQRTINLFS